MDQGQLLAVLAVLGVALVRLVAPEIVDDTVILLLLAAAVLGVVPVSSLKSLKAAGIELTLASPQVEGAVEGLALDRVADARLKAALNSLSDLLPVIRGARVLWIDDRPEKVLGERRVLRALGVTVVSAASSERAKDILREDSDFDLLISDVQRRGETHEKTGGIALHEGVNFICWLRDEHPDPAVRDLSVVFYAAYDWRRLVEFTRPARELQPEAQIANSVVDMMPKVIRQLADVRTAPISAPAEKIPTGIRPEP